MFREHLYNGIGLRHVIDWMMFVNACLDDAAFPPFSFVLEKAGLLTLARTVTRMCQLYLGLTETITWCVDVDEVVCADLMNYIMIQGNFGNKRNDDKEVKVMSRYRTPFTFLKGMQKKGMDDWTAAKKYPALRAFAWLYTGVQAAKVYITPAGRKKLKNAFVEKRQRMDLLNRLYGDKTTTTPLSQTKGVSRFVKQHKP